MFAFLLAAIPITLLIAGNISEDIRLGFGENLAEKCTTEAKFTGEQLQRCELKSVEAGKLTNIKIEDCGICGPRPNYPDEQGLCLTGEDLKFCEKGISKIGFLIPLGSFLEGISNPVRNLDKNTFYIIVAVLFVGGYFLKGRMRI